MAEILLYSSLYSSSVASLIKEMEAAKGEDMTLRVNSPGGEVFQTYGLVAKYQEHPKRKVIKVDGIAASSAAFLCCYADEVECLDVSSFLFHRAAFWYEDNPTYFTDDIKAALNEMNAQLRAAMESKMTAADFEKETGVSYDSLFSLDSRIDVSLNAKQAKKLGLVQTVTKITPAKRKDIEAMAMQFAANHVWIPEAEATEIPQPPTPKILKPNTMTIEKLKAEHPDVYAAAVKEGVTAERDRVGSFLAFIDVDPETVAKGIKAGDNLTATAMAELSRKEFNKKASIKAEDENAPAVTTEQPTAPATPQTEAAKKLEAFNAEVDAKLGLGKK